MKIESTDIDIRTMLSSDYYRIPRFQRPYSWEAENVQEFWDDVIRDNPTDYFIGSIVVYRSGQQRYSIVDGQQRLTTITILLAVLRNALQKLGEADLAKGVHRLIERHNIDNQPEFILSTETSYPFFQNNIQQWGEPDLETEVLKEEEKLQASFSRLTGLVDDALDSVDTDSTLSAAKKELLARKKLVEIRDAVLSLKIIFIKLDNEDDAYIIFETLNTRGKDLSLSDLVKTHLTRNIKNKNAATDKVKLKWEKLLETVEGSSVPLSCDDFIHHAWLSKYEYLPAKKLYKILKKKIVGTGAANAYLDSLLEDAGLYRSIFEVSYGKWAKEEAAIVNALNALTLLRVEQPVPCILSVLRKYKLAHKIKKKQVEDALLAIEGFHFLVTGVTSQSSSGGISAMYASLGRRLHDAKDSQATAVVIKELKQKLRDRLPSEEEVIAAFPDIVYTDKLTRQRKFVKYILVRLHQAAPSPVSVNYDAMTIEHLASQSQTGQPALDESVIGQLGNLLLVPEKLNQKLKNKSFKEKKFILSASGFKLPAEIKNATKWGAPEIVSRSQKLAAAAHKQWAF